MSPPNASSFPEQFDSGRGRIKTCGLVPGIRRTQDFHFDRQTRTKSIVLDSVDSEEVAFLLY